MHAIVADLTVSPSEFKRNPAKVIRDARSQPVAVLTHNKPAFYMVDPSMFEALLEELENVRLAVSNERMIVTEWRFAAGAETGWHRHAHDYCVVPITDGELLIETGGSDARFPLVAGRSYSRNAGVEHNVVNATECEIVFVEVELR